MAENLPENASVVPHFADVALGQVNVASTGEVLRAFREQQSAWRPRTALGQRLKELRSQFVASGGRLLADADLDIEWRKRQGTGLAED